MNFQERINAVLHHQKADKVPFVSYEHVIPRGSFERYMRNKGMGLYVERATYWSEMPNVKTESQRQKDTYLTIYHTPVGQISSGRIGNKAKSMIENEDDYEPAIFMINDTIFHADYSVYSNTVRDLGSDGIVRGSGMEPPYAEAIKYVPGEQKANQMKFPKLMDALEKRTRRLFEVVSESPTELVSIGHVSDLWDTELFENYFLPFCQEYVPKLHRKGKICAIDLSNQKTRTFAGLIAQTGVDVVMGFAPHPAGDMSIEEAMNIWGKDIIVWVSFPETVLFEGADRARDYTRNLLMNSDSRMIIYLQSVRNLADEAMENTFQASLRAIMEMKEPQR